MRSVFRVLLACNLLVLAALVASATDDDEAWIKYKIEFNKTYNSEAEEQVRKKVFLENKRYVDSHNIKSNTGFKQGINPLSDLTTGEINDSRCGFRWRPTEERTIDNVLAILLRAMDSPTNNTWYEDYLTLPYLDWRNSGRVSKVKDQGSCGSCWAFATTGALEGILAGENRGILLSEQNLVDCSRSYGNKGCSGGLMDLAFRYVRDYGIMANRDYPYRGKDEKCKFVKSKSILNVRGSATLPRGNEAMLRVALSATGPIPVAIDASLKSFHSYKSGVYDDKSCKSSGSSLNHAVLLVGYGTHPSHGPYWIIKNSWGKKWGEFGYMRLARNRQNLCGIASYGILPVSD